MGSRSPCTCPTPGVPMLRTLLGSRRVTASGFLRLRVLGVVSPPFSPPSIPSLNVSSNSLKSITWNNEHHHRELKYRQPICRAVCLRCLVTTKDGKLCKVITHNVIRPIKRLNRLCIAGSIFLEHPMSVKRDVDKFIRSLNKICFLTIMVLCQSTALLTIHYMFQINSLYSKWFIPCTVSRHRGRRRRFPALAGAAWASSWEPGAGTWSESSSWLS